MTGTDCSRSPYLPSTVAQVQAGSSPVLLLHKHICTCCSCEKLKFFWHRKVMAIWRTGLEPAWGCVPPKQRQGGPPPAQEAQEVTGLGTKNINSASLVGSKQNGQAMPQSWFSDCQLREGPSCTGKSVASPSALLELAPTSHMCSITSQNPPSRDGKPPRKGPGGSGVTAGTSRYLPVLGEASFLLQLAVLGRARAGLCLLPAGLAQHSCFWRMRML